jgi:hypothetical protein
MAKKKGKAAYLSVYVSADLKDRLERLAHAQDTSVSRLVERLLNDLVHQEEMTVKAMQHPVLGPTLAAAFARPEVLRALGSVMREELTDEQLRLFSAVTSGVVAAAGKSPASPPTPTPAKKGKKR